MLKYLLPICLFLLLSCEADSAEPARRSTVEWDASSLVCIFERGSYGRIRELPDKTLIAVAEGPQGVMVSHSADAGRIWSAPIIAAPHPAGINMAVPEVMLCADGSLLLTYNPRIRGNGDDATLRYGIRARKSSDGGKTWGDEIFVFDAGHTRRTGCWEPATLQLPSGEIQLYFANESRYTLTEEQDISMCRSFDGGLTWSDPEVVSFRAGHRDGMPVPVLLTASQQIIVVIEDNGYPSHRGRMQPAVVRTTLADNWAAGFVDGESPRRDYALAEKLPREDNAGAPYICLASTGEVLLSYQGTEGRNVAMVGEVKNKERCQRMIVAVGDEQGRNFTNRSVPFDIPLGPGGVWSPETGYYCHWNSLCTTSCGDIWAVTTTNAYGTHVGGIWAVRGVLK